MAFVVLTPAQISAHRSQISATGRSSTSIEELVANAPGFSFPRPAHPGAISAIGLDTAPRPLRLMVWACLDRPWSLPPPEPRVRPLVGHFRLASKGT